MVSVGEMIRSGKLRVIPHDSLEVPRVKARRKGEPLPPPPSAPPLLPANGFAKAAVQPRWVNTPPAGAVTVPEVRRYAPRSDRNHVVNPTTTFVRRGSLVSCKTASGHSVAWPLADLRAAIAALEAQC